MTDQLTEVRVVYKPCDTPCPKCGSLDILRHFYRRGQAIESKDYNKAPLPRWVGGSGYSWWASRDLISHHCRCCQYDWVDGPLPKQGGQKKAKSPAPTVECRHEITTGHMTSNGIGKTWCNQCGKVLYERTETAELA